MTRAAVSPQIGAWNPFATSEADIGLVFGGGGDGLMGRLARATLAAGGRVTGIIPKFLVAREHALVGAQELVVVDSMHQRKQLMFDRADAFIALPGGVGTLEELVEQLTWVQLQRHRKPVLLADIDGFWRPLLALFAHMRRVGRRRRVRLVGGRAVDVEERLSDDAARRGAPFGRARRVTARPSALFLGAR